VSVLVPLYGFLQGDTIGLLVLVHDTDTVAEIARKLQQAAAVRLPPKARASVSHGGHRLDPELTVAQAGLSALDRVDVIQEAE
jgi:hypothetical protein